MERQSRVRFPAGRQKRREKSVALRCVALRSVGASASCVLLPARFCQRACSIMRRGGAGAAARALPSRSASTVPSEFQSCARCQHFCGVCTWPATWFTWMMCSFAPPRPAQRFRTGWTRRRCPQIHPIGHASGGPKGEPLASHGAPRGGKKKKKDGSVHGKGPSAHKGSPAM